MKFTWYQIFKLYLVIVLLSGLILSYLATPTNAIEVTKIYNVNNDASVISSFPGQNFGHASAVYSMDDQEMIYIDLGASYQQANLNLYCYFYCSVTASIYNTTSFNQGTITYNNRPPEQDLKVTQSLVSGWNVIPVNNVSRYIEIKTNGISITYFRSSEATSQRPYVSYLIDVSTVNLSISEWPKFHNGLSNNGTNNNPSYANGELNWSVPVDAGSSEYVSAAIDINGTIYTGEFGGAFHALNKDGSEKWSYSTGDNIETAPAIDDFGDIYFGSDDFSFYAVHSDGSLKWSVPTGGMIRSSPTVINNTVYFGSDDGIFYALYAYDGSTRWTYNVASQIDTSPAIDRNGTIYFGTNDGFLYALNDDGTQKWVKNYGGIFSSPTIDTNGNIYFGSTAGQLVKLNSDGNEVWVYITSDAIYSSPAIGPTGTIYFGSDDGNFYALNQDGTLKYSYTTGGSIRTSPVVDLNNNAFFASSDTNIYELNIFGQKKWQYNIGVVSSGSPILNANGEMLIGDGNGNFLEFKSTTPSFDPDGFVFDNASNPISGVKVVISNNTYTDECILTTCYTDVTGHWAGTIYEDGVYTITASKQGYATTISSQALVVGGSATNIIMFSTQAVLTGHVYTLISGTGTTAIKGNLQDLRVDTCGQAGLGGTLTVGHAGDGSTYVLKLKDVDSGNQQSVWALLKDGNFLYDDQLVNTNELLQLKIYETFYESVYVDIRVASVFQGTETSFAQTCGAFEHMKKTPSLLDWLFNVVKDLVMGAVFGSGATPTVLNFNDVFASIDGSNTNPVTFNATKDKDAIGYADFTINNPATIFNFNMALTAESTTGTAGKMEIGYTDDTQTQDSGFTDIILINSKQSCQANMLGYCTPQHDFKSIDINGNGIIRVWFKFSSGYSNFKLYEFYLNAWGTTSQTPLAGATVYSINGSNTTQTDTLGAYTLLLGLKNNTVYYTKVGYETKNYTFLFNSSNVSYTQDVILNATNGTLNSTKEYITVPNFVQGTATNGNYKTLSHTSLFGGYQIAICPQLGLSCTRQDVSSNTEGTFVLDQNLPVGTYQADLTGFLGGLLDINRVVIVSTNFTVTSSTPHVNWQTNPYNMGETMVLGVYVPTGSQYVNVTYLNNGSVIYTNSFGATGTVQNASFVTNTNISVSQYQPGQYQACIDSGNCDVTTLRNVSLDAFDLLAPGTVTWGDVFNIVYTAPRTALLQVTDKNNVIVLSQDVPTGNSLSGLMPFNTTILPNGDNLLVITLSRNSAIVKSINVTVNSQFAQSGKDMSGATTTLINENFIPIIMIMTVFGALGMGIGGVMGSVMGFGTGFLVCAAINIIPVWALYLFAIIAVSGFAIVMAGKIIKSGGE